MILENEFAKIKVEELGGEITSIFLKELKQELLVNKNSWGRTAPWLFPIVGEIHAGHIKHDGKVYKIPRHGFVRDKKWDLTKTDKHIKATYNHKANDEYPFDFKLDVKYVLLNDEVKIEFNVNAKDEARYNVGWHPAFNYKGDIHLNSTFEYESSHNKLVGHKMNKRSELPFSEIENDKTYIYDNFSVELNYENKPVYIHWCDYNFTAIWTKNKDEFISIEAWAKNLDLLNATPSLENKDMLNGNNKLEINIFFANKDKKCFKKEDLII